MAKSTVSRRPHQRQGTRHETATGLAEGVLGSIKSMQAAAWLLDQLHIGELSGRGLEATCSVGPHDPPLEEIRTELTYIAINLLAENLAAARAELEAAAAAPKAVA